MIVELSPQFDDQWTGGEIAEEELLSLSRLLDAHADGRHIFVPTRASVPRLVSDERLSRRQQAAAQRIGEELSALRGQAKAAHFTVLAVPNEPPVSTRANQSFLVPLTYFEAPEATSPTRFIVENSQYDGQFYLTLCDSFADVLRQGRNIRLDVTNGGGDTTGQVYRQNTLTVAPVICVIDSDRSCPQCPVGETAAHVEEQVGGEVGRICRAEILPVRSAENFIPSEIISDIYSDNIDLSQRYEAVQRLEVQAAQRKDDPSDQLIRFANYKTGLRKSFLFGASEEGRQFLIRLWAVIDPNEEAFDADGEPELVWEGVSQGLIRKFCEHHNRGRNTLDRLRAACERGPLWSELEDLVSLILAFGASIERMRAI